MKFDAFLQGPSVCYASRFCGAQAILSNDGDQPKPRINKVCSGSSLSAHIYVYIGYDMIRHNMIRHNIA